jgi:NADH:ubiquinone oxidoreductase subunit 5 (subunit L)/multisubunit Na+/H+ antiporter MnhA subunit
MSMMLLAPLVGSVLWFLLGRRGLHKLVAVGCVLTIFVSFLCMLKFFFSDALPVHVHLFDWMRLGADSSLGLSEKGIMPLGWSWLVIFGTIGTFTIGWFLAPALDGQGRPAKD